MKTKLLLATAMMASFSFAAEPPARPHILGLSHMAFYVHDLAKSRAFYKDFLGFDEPYSLTNKDGSLHLTWIKINDGQLLELFPEKEAGTDRLYHIALETDDAEGMRQYLSSKGVKVPDKLPFGRIGNANYFITDPDGHTVEIVEYKPAGWTAKNKGHHIPDTRISDHMRHGGITVRDLEASLKFYRDILGFKEIWRGSASGRQLSWVHVRVADGTDFIELMLGNPTPDRLGTLHHFCLEVPDIAKASETLKARQLPAGCKAPTEMKTGINRKRQINYFDPDGTRVELMEPHTVDGQPAPSSTAPPPKPVSAATKPAAEPPLPYGPVPSTRQLQWQEMEFIGFLHFTVNTFTDKEWGDGDESEKVFNPTNFNADQIVHTAKEAGMKELILTCKHHDGFCLWPSRFTEHSVKKSPWRNDKGDVLKEISDACRKYGLNFGVYLSPWDRNRADYGQPEYIAYYRNQLRELLTNYGTISEVWFHGANGGSGYYGSARETRTIDNRTYYDWPTTWQILRNLQPAACIFSDGGAGHALGGQ